MTIGSYIPVGTPVKVYGEDYVIIEVKEVSGIFFNTYEYTLQSKNKTYPLTLTRRRRSDFTLDLKLKERR